MIDLISLIGTIKGDQRAREALAFQASDAAQNRAQQGKQFSQSLAEQIAGRNQSGQQFGQTLAEQVAARGQQGSQFGANLAQNQNQFLKSLAEQVAGREQQGSQFGQTLDFEKQQWQWQLEEFRRYLKQLGMG